MSLSAENRALVERVFAGDLPYTDRDGMIISEELLGRLLDAARAEGSASPPPPAEGVGKEEHGSSCTDLSCAQTHSQAPSPAEGLVRQREDDDCTICAIAMATGLSYESVMGVAATSEGGYRYRGTPGTVSPRGVLLDLGYEAVRIAFGGIRSSVVQKLLWGRRAILSLPSINGFQGHHDAYWNGREIVDPTNKTAYAPDALATTTPLFAVVLDELAAARLPEPPGADPRPTEGVGKLVEDAYVEGFDDGHTVAMSSWGDTSLAAAEAASPVLLEGDLGGSSGADLAVQGTTALDPETPRSAGGEG